MSPTTAAGYLGALDKENEPRASGSALLTQLNGGYGPKKRQEALDALRVLIAAHQPVGSPFGDVAA